MRPFVLTAVVIALSVPAHPARAQSTVLAQPPAAEASLPSATRHTAPGFAADVAAGPRLGTGRAGITPVAHDDVVPSPRPTPVVQESRRRNGQILTVVGGAIFLAGLLIDDDDVGTVVAVGGLAVGVYGLIQWLQASVSGVTSP
ncbi:MAG TPA: hypothetical protein VLE53_06395 [Gemmatimonadaceae bacterium]|nr:hypothetical protein [Gemmatimonadaceae bacterium]